MKELLIMKITNIYIRSALMMFTAVVITGGVCEPSRAAVYAGCTDVTDIEGVYHCTGECIVTASDFKKSVVLVTGESDTIKRYSGTKEAFYENTITGEGDFHEVEIGVLVGTSLHAATAKVSDGGFPVLEEYLFEYDGSCKAKGYKKIVRNPSGANFKSCLLRCLKVIPNKH